MNIAVSVEHLTKKYKLYEDKWGPIKEVISKKKLHKDFLALKDISLDFPKGEAIGVLGKNGSGKSTLLKIITGIADPTAGKITVNGSLVFLDVSSGIDSELTGYENIFMKGTLLGYSKEEMLTKVDDIIEFSELGEFINQPVKNYSSGMRSKLGFAISVNVEPDILIVDEALAVGDSAFRQKCMNKMNQFKELGKTIIFVSHDHHAVESFCSKAAWIHQGELITYGDSKLVGSIYNDFMAGRKTLETVKSELLFSHAIESVSPCITEKGHFSTELKGYLYQTDTNEAPPFELVLRDKRTGEYRSKAITLTDYSGDSSLPEKIRNKAGLNILLSEEDFPNFFKPGNYLLAVRYKNNHDEWIEFPLRAGSFTKINIEEPVDSLNGRFKYKVNINNNQFILKIENRDTVQQQVNKIWFEDKKLHIEGVAFVRGYETPKANDISINLQLVNLETFEKREYPADIRETEEITENPSFNPQGKNYNFSEFKVEIELEELNFGKYEGKLTYRMNQHPYYELIILVWASKRNEYPSEPHLIAEREIRVQTETKYLQLEVKKPGHEE
ncbi:ABC transporter ATP-binding protein [Mesobacillus maritimus]|uniref:ABC transporter ATP-binding protein n=1 Tax=Mesobacillus maritimus TaxID=1643336 RepID=UPI0038516F1C